MAKFKVEITRTAEKQLKKIDKSFQSKIVKLILSLANNPYPSGCKQLVGYHDLFRIRVGNYRIIYSVENKKLIIIILKLGHRKDIYK